MTAVLIVGFICLTVVAIVYIVKKYSCQHEWIDVETEYSDYCYTYKYKNVTQKCKKCGKVEITKYQLN